MIKKVLQKIRPGEDNPEPVHNLSKDLKQLPIIVSGTGRSGTSVLLGAIAAHPQVHNRHQEKGEAPFITKFLDFLVSVDESKAADYVNRNYRSGQEEKNVLFVNLLRDIHSPSAKDTNSKYWPAKAALNEAEHKKFISIAGEFPLVKIYRNPISVIDSSMNFHGFEHLPFDRLCKRWLKGTRDLGYFNSAPRTYVVKYEDLVNDPKSEFKKILSAINVDHSDRPAKFFSETKINSAYKSKKKPSVKERWDSWSKDQQQEFIELCGDIAKELGYEIPQAK